MAERAAAQQGTRSGPRAAAPPAAEATQPGAKA